MRHAVSMPRNTDAYPASLLPGFAHLATATSLAMASQPSLGGHPSLDSHQPSTSRVFAPPLLGSLSSVQQMATLSPAPANGLEESDVAVMSCWMNKVALQLDDVLIDGVHVLAEPVTVAGMVLGSGFRHAAQQGSPSARFQNLLIYARSHGTVQGFYEAMLTRYSLSSCPFLPCQIMPMMLLMQPCKRSSGFAQSKMQTERACWELYYRLMCK